MSKMKLSSRLCGLFGSGAFVLISYTGFFSTLSPWDALYWTIEGQPISVSYAKFMQCILLSTLGAIIAGYIGHSMGNILSHPKGKRPVKKKAAVRPRPPEAEAPADPAIEATPLEVIAELPEETPIPEAPETP